MGQVDAFADADDFLLPGWITIYGPVGLREGTFEREVPIDRIYEYDFTRRTYPN